MWSRLVTRVVIYVLGSTRVSLEDKNLLTGLILDKLQAAPLRAILETDEETGVLLVGGKSIDIEKGKQLMSAAQGALRNPALNLIREQVVHEAFIGAAVKSQHPYDLVFYRAALWWGQQVDIHLKKLAGKNEEPNL